MSSAAERFSTSEPPLVAEGGVRAPATPVDDPYLALDDLMAVMEALCPTWPVRPTFSGAERMLL
jgi:hypothetical protein